MPDLDYANPEADRRRYRPSYFSAAQNLINRRALRTSRPDLGIPQDLTAAQFTGQNIDRLRGSNLPYMSSANEALLQQSPIAYRGAQDLYAQAIGQRYRGTSTIPQGAHPGYYNRKGEYLGPTHDASGNSLPPPRGTTGVVGTPAAQPAPTRLSPEESYRLGFEGTPSFDPSRSPFARMYALGYSGGREGAGVTQASNIQLAQTRLPSTFSVLSGLAALSPLKQLFWNSYLGGRELASNF